MRGGITCPGAKPGAAAAPGKGAARRIPYRQGLDARPPAGDARRNPGHWAADLMLFSAYGQAALVLHESHSRLLLAQLRPAGKAAEPIAAAIGQLLRGLPAAARQTLTLDNGAEFARHYRLRDLGIAP